ncbi:MAG: YqcC family protein [Pseudoalteromonas prydzensis]|uniref:YqcC family protein n=1 Tax=Pseudoalteromonas prydzensis TaxID=182141 RepID=UPI003F9C48F8
MYQQIQVYLTQLEGLLKQHQLWQDQPLAVQALNSTVPFCHDTMAFEQWLQFVFIEKMQLLVSHAQPLPANFAIAPMAELMLAHKSGGAAVTQLLAQLDQLLGSNNE